MKHLIANKISKITGNQVSPEEYEFFNTDKNLQNPIFICLGGSYAYGTNKAGSDIDLRGVALRNKTDILLNRDFNQIVNTDTDTTIYSLEKLITLLTNCNPNTIEILGCKPEHYVYISDIGKELIRNKEMFLSKRCVKSFMGYANQQMYRLQQKSLVAMSEAELNVHICKTINSVKDTLTRDFDMEGIDFHLKDGKIVMNLHIDDYPTEDLSSVLGVINNTLREYKKNSVRNEKALAHNKIAKHSMHLLRLYMMCEDILLHGEINTYREKEHDLLMSIRNGEFLGKDGKPIASFYDIVHNYEARIEDAITKTKLPEIPDTEKIDKFVVEANLSLF